MSAVQTSSVEMPMDSKNQERSPLAKQRFTSCQQKKAESSWPHLKADLVLPLKVNLTEHGLQKLYLAKPTPASIRNENEQKPSCDLWNTAGHRNGPALPHNWPVEVWKPWKHVDHSGAKPHPLGSERFNVPQHPLTLIETPFLRAAGLRRLGLHLLHRAHILVRAGALDGCVTEHTSNNLSHHIYTC